MQVTWSWRRGRQDWWGLASLQRGLACPVGGFPRSEGLVGHQGGWWICKGEGGIPSQGSGDVGRLKLA